MRRIALAELGGRGTFTANPGFSPELADPAKRDRIAEAFQAGMAEGRRVAEEAAEARFREARAELDAIELAFARFDARSAELLQERLRTTVATICQAMAGEIALDPVRLASRVEAAAAMLRRRQEERVVRLHPADFALIRDRVAPELNLQPDASLDRGQLRVDGEDGGVEDGAEQWRAALAEALGTCLP